MPYPLRGQGWTYILTSRRPWNTPPQQRERGWNFFHHEHMSATAATVQAVSSPKNWHEFFTKWPKSLSHRGVLITSYGEHFTYTDFVASDAYLVAIRETPDIDGARTIVLDYEGIRAVKILDSIKTGTFAEFGFDVSAVRASIDDGRNVF